MISFKINSKLMSQIKYAFIKSTELSANQKLIYNDGKPYIICNPPINKGTYLISFRAYKDGRHNCIIAPMNDWNY